MVKRLLTLTVVVALCLTTPAWAENTPPVADAGEDLTGIVYHYIDLSGSATDADGDAIVAWKWELESGGVFFWYPSDPSDQNPSIWCFNPGDYTFSLMVSDGVDWSAKDYVTVSISESQIDPPAHVLSWGSEGTGEGEFTDLGGIATDTSGYVYVADNNRIQKFDRNGTFVDSWGSYGSDDGQFDCAMGVATDSNGNVYVADMLNHRIQKFTSDGTFVAKWGSYGTGDGQFTGPWIVRTDSAGNVYVADGGARLQIFDGDGDLLINWGFDATAKIGNMAVDSDGYVWVWDNQHGFIRKYDGEANELDQIYVIWESGGRGGLAIDSDGSIYFADTGGDEVYQYDSDGNMLTRWGSGGSGDGQFNYATWIAVDSIGDVYVVDRGNYRVQKFSRDPVAKLEALADDVVELNLQQGITSSLDGKLEAVEKALDDANDRNDAAALNALEAFISAVEAQSGNKITTAQADDLIARAQHIIDTLEDGS